MNLPTSATDVDPRQVSRTRATLCGQRNKCSAALEEYFSVRTERPRARRFSFVANVELTDLQSETNIHVRTSDLSLYGCCVEFHKPFPTGTKVRVKIAHRSGNFVALGRVSYAKTEGEMGIVFTRIDPNDQLMLERWIEELRQK